jgi:hypothetical protein
MTLIRYSQVIAAILMAAAAATAAEDDPQVVTISATAGGPTTFVIAPKDPSGRQRVVSTSLLIQRTLVPALVTGSRPVNVDLVPGSNVIRRVQAFGLGKLIPNYQGEYEVSRIATQRKPDGTDHLEVFLSKVGGQEETAYNVNDPFLQQLLIAAFRKPDTTGTAERVPVDVQFDGAEIATVTLGEKFERK